MTEQEQVQVSQADRDASSAFLGVWFPRYQGFAQEPLEEAFARHRQTTTAEALKAAAVEFNKLTAIAVSDARRYATAEALEAMREAREAIQGFVECARYDPTMDGKGAFKGWAQSDLRRAESRGRTTLTRLTAAIAKIEGEQP
jgi:hypothetical protein